MGDFITHYKTMKEDSLKSNKLIFSKLCSKITIRIVD